MGLLKPVDIRIAEAIIKKPEVEKQLQQNEITALLERNRLSLDDTAGVLGGLMHYAEKEATKLKAVELSFRIHGVLKPTEDEQNAAVNKQPIVNLNFFDSNVNLNGVFCPNRE